MSKGFFKRLNSKRSRDVLARIKLDDGTTVNDGSNIAQECTLYFEKILSDALVHCSLSNI